jgi:cysteinyl-tRNA synthetase
VSSAAIELRLYNTATRRKERFEALEEGRVGLYTCGPTVYAPSHIGNMRSYVFADLLKRTLCAFGYEVRHVINVTDVGHLTNDSDDGDDKMELAAKESGRRAEDIAAEYTQRWIDDTASLGCLPPDVLCLATEHISEQIDLAQRLEAGGFTYRLPDGLYFDTSKFERYGDFARLDLEAQEAGARVDSGVGKRNPSDFAVWKFAERGVERQQEWDSPWGRGFPGWHLECSAMSTKYLGDRFDIHTGGEDHISIHHTNEIAQSECGYGVRPWVRTWMHNAFLIFSGEKMAKSVGNVRVLQDLVDAGISPRGYRYFLLQAVYRMPQSFKMEALEAAETGYRRLLTVAESVREAAGEGDRAAQAPYRERFRAALADDLNAPQAMAVTWEVARSSELAEVDKRDLLLGFDEILGLDLAHARTAADAEESDPRIEALLVERDAARAAKDWGTADRIRDELGAEGVEIIDTPGGAKWKRK